MKAAAAANAGRFVLISSLGVYGTETLKRWGTLDESTPIDPHPEQRDPYTFSKVHQELVARELSEELKIPLVVVRPGVIYGPGRSAVTSRVGLPVGPFVIRMGGGQELPYVFVENCADGIMQAGLKPGIEGETFNLVDDHLPNGKANPEVNEAGWAEKEGSLDSAWSDWNDCSDLRTLLSVD